MSAPPVEPDPGPPPRAAPHWRRTFWAVWVADLVASIGMMSFLPFFPSYLRELGLSERAEIAAWSGAVFGAAPLAAAFMGPVWGSIGDRWGRRWMVVRALLAVSVFVGGMAFVRSPTELLLLRLGQGVFSGFIAPSITLVSLSAPPDRQGRASGSIQTALAAGAVLGPALGGLLSVTIGMRQVFLCVAAAGAAGALLVALVAREDPATRRAPSGRGGLRTLVDDVRGDLTLMASRPGLRAVLALVFCVQFGLGATNPLLELYVGDLLPADPERVRLSTSALFSAGAVVNLVAMPLWGRMGDRRGEEAALVRSGWATSATLALQALAAGLPLLFAARVLFSASFAGVSPCSYAYVAREMPVESRGGAFGALFSARTFAVSTSAMLGGWAAGTLGIPGLFLVGAALVLVTTTALRRVPRGASPAADASRAP